MGHLDARKMYRDVQCIGIEGSYRDVLDGKVERFYGPEQKKKLASVQA